MTPQEIHVINSLSGEPLDLVTNVTRVLPKIIKAVSESVWISVDEMMPEPSSNFLVRIDANPVRNNNQMVAKFIPRFTEKSGHDDWCEYCPDKDMSFVPEGWYANTTYIGDEYSNYFINEKVTHWTPLPKPVGDK